MTGLRAVTRFSFKRLKLEVLLMVQSVGHVGSVRGRNATRTGAAASAVLALVVLPTPVLACRGPQYQQAILLDAIPPAAESSEVIAKVEILQVQIRRLPALRPFNVAHARILHSVRGAADGQIIEIYAQPTSCGGGLDQRAVGRQGFIAGRFQLIADQAFFMGRWTEHQLRRF